MADQYGDNKQQQRPRLKRALGMGACPMTPTHLCRAQDASRDVVMKTPTPCRLAPSLPEASPLRRAPRRHCLAHGPGTDIDMLCVGPSYMNRQVPHLKHLQDLFLRRRRRGLFVADPHVTVSSAPFPCF